MSASFPELAELLVSKMIERLKGFEEQEKQRDEKLYALQEESSKKFSEWHRAESNRIEREFWVKLIRTQLSCFDIAFALESPGFSQCLAHYLGFGTPLGSPIQEGETNQSQRINYKLSLVEQLWNKKHESLWKESLALGFIGVDDPRYPRFQFLQSLSSYRAYKYNEFYAALLNGDVGLPNHRWSIKLREYLEKELDDWFNERTDLIFAAKARMQLENEKQKQLDLLREASDQFAAANMAGKGQASEQNQTQRALPRVRTIRLFSGLVIPKDWTEISKVQQELIEAMRRSSPVPENSLVTKIKSTEPSNSKTNVEKIQNKTVKASPSGKAKTHSTAKSDKKRIDESVPESDYSKQELKEADSALKRAVRMDKNGELPEINDLLQERNEKMKKGEYVNMPKEEYSRSEAEFNEKLHARMRLDLSQAPDQRIIYADDKKAASFSELLRDGTIHSCEQQNLGKGTYHKSEEWIYTDGTSVSWSGDFEQHASSKGALATSHYKEESIEIYRDPLHQDTYSSSTSLIQDANGGASLPVVDSSLLKSQEMQEKLEDLRKFHHHGPWEYARLEKG